MGRDKKVRGERPTLGSSPGSPMATYQTRICDYGGMERVDGDGALSAYVDIYGRVERKLFAEVAAGETVTSLKSEYLKGCGCLWRGRSHLSKSSRGCRWTAWAGRLLGRSGQPAADQRC